MSRVVSLSGVRLDPLAGFCPPITPGLFVAALSPNTRRAYDAQWRQWVAHAIAFGHSVMPADPATVARWLLVRAHGTADSRSLAAKSAPTVGSKLPGVRSRRGRQSTHPSSLPTIRTAIAAIRLAHLAHGLVFDTGHPEIKLALKAVAHADTRPVVQARPMRAEFVQQLMETVDLSPRDCRDAALLAVGYCFARRRSELVGLDYDSVGSGSGCLRITPVSLELHLSRAKQRARKPEIFVVPRQHNALAVDAIKRWIEAGCIRPGEPLFRRVYRSGRVSDERLDAQSVSLIIKARVRDHLVNGGMPERQAMAEAEHFAGHSLRVGFAVAAAEAGASVLAIQKALGHRSPTMAARYAHAAELARMSPHNLKGVALGSRSRRRKRRGS